MRLYRIVLIAGILMLCLTDANAQINPGTFLSQSTQATSTNFYFARPNDITIIVDLVGFVQRPGRYEIASSIDLVNLISLAGGPTPDGDLSSVTIIRMTGNGKTMTRREIQIDLEDLTTVKQEALQLTPGDLVVMDRTNWSTFRDVFGVVAPVATLAIVVTQFILSEQRQR